MERKHKEAKLMADEFNPFGKIKSFWMVPKHVAALKKLSMGAKVMYGVLVGMSGKYGTAFPTREKLRVYLGNPSDSTMYRWQRELEKYQLIRVRQKGRGLSNNYYFLRSPLLGNLSDEERQRGGKVVYRGSQTTEPILVTLAQAEALFDKDVDAWLSASIESVEGEELPFPKPAWKMPRKEYLELKAVYAFTLQQARLR